MHAVARYAAPAHTVERIISGSSESTHAVGRIGVGVDIGTGDSERGELEGGETGGDGAQSVHDIDNYILRSIIYYYVRRLQPRSRVRADR